MSSEELKNVEDQKITKPKLAKNVEKGKKLAEWNRQNRVNLSKTEDAKIQDARPCSYNAYMYGIGALSILAIGLIVFNFYGKDKSKMVAVAAPKAVATTTAKRDPLNME